jgi:hypothetical protein
MAPAMRVKSTLYSTDQRCNRGFSMQGNVSQGRLGNVCMDFPDVWEIIREKFQALDVFARDFPSLGKIGVRASGICLY